MEKEEIEEIRKQVNNGAKLFAFESKKLLSALEASQREAAKLSADLSEIKEAYLKCESEFSSKMDLEEKIKIHAEDENNLWRTLNRIFSKDSKQPIAMTDNKAASQKVVDVARKLVKARREENIFDHGLAADELEEAIEILARTEKEAQ